MSNNVPHGHMYHAEIRVENSEGFHFVSAFGDTIAELIENVTWQYDRNIERDPEMTIALYDPNGEKVDITPKVYSLIGKI